MPVNSYPWFFNSASNRMVTIGPLIFLGLLGVTFHIGARPMRPHAAVGPIPRHGRGIHEPDTNITQTLETPTSGPALGRGRTWDVSEDTVQAVERLRSGTEIQGGRNLGPSEDSIALSCSEGTARRPGVPTGHDGEARGERQSSDAAINGQDSPMVHTCVEGVVEPITNPFASLAPVEGSRKKFRLLRNVWQAGPDNGAHPEHVSKVALPMSACVSLASYIPRHV